MGTGHASVNPWYWLTSFARIGKLRYQFNSISRTVELPQPPIWLAHLAAGTRAVYLCKPATRCPAASVPGFLKRARPIQASYSWAWLRKLSHVSSKTVLS
jgi:hypothetical protein